MKISVQPSAGFTSPSVSPTLSSVRQLVVPTVFSVGSPLQCPDSLIRHFSRSLSSSCGREVEKSDISSCSESGHEPLGPFPGQLSAQWPLLLCACRYSVPPEHGKRLERLAKGMVFAPWVGSDLPGSCARGSRMSTFSGPFLSPHVGGEPDCQFGYISEQVKSQPFPTLSWEGA